MKRIREEYRWLSLIYIFFRTLMRSMRVSKASKIHVRDFIASESIYQPKLSIHTLSDVAQKNSSNHVIRPDLSIPAIPRQTEEGDHTVNDSHQ
ncbi:hypothetical protein CDAR_194961 [Caerostris darwini]|uniref:Uncharacterized protein n=1 Tax=Caerostris darwini TaxID=1538125 RepID=A0AAV4X5C0_9ARAC|nr:hypothetical protein CDAR_194961 [Caerostris darwini]